MAKIIAFPRSRFDLGEVVHHRLFDYRGVIVDVDPTCQASEQWYETVATSRPPKDKPWYHVLVHGTSQMTYVAERHLERDGTGTAISHPMLATLFTGFESGRYVRGGSLTN